MAKTSARPKPRRERSDVRKRRGERRAVIGRAFCKALNLQHKTDKQLAGSLARQFEISPRTIERMLRGEGGTLRARITKLERKLGDAGKRLEDFLPDPPPKNHRGLLEFLNPKYLRQPPDRLNDERLRISGIRWPEMVKVAGLLGCGDVGDEGLVRGAIAKITKLSDTAVQLVQAAVQDMSVKRIDLIKAKLGANAAQVEWWKLQAPKHWPATSAPDCGGRRPASPAAPPVANGAAAGRLPAAGASAAMLPLADIGDATKIVSALLTTTDGRGVMVPPSSFPIVLVVHPCGKLQAMALPSGSSITNAQMFPPTQAGGIGQCSVVFQSGPTG